jgi:hypothetical protein
VRFRLASQIFGLGHQPHKHRDLSDNNQTAENADNTTQLTSPNWVHRAQAGRFLSHYPISAPQSAEGIVDYHALRCMTVET